MDGKELANFATISRIGRTEEHTINETPFRSAAERYTAYCIRFKNRSSRNISKKGLTLMARIWLAIRIFFLVLFQETVARQVAEVLEKRKLENKPSEAKPPAKPADKAEPKPAKQPPKPARSEAVTLLATLQREARFVDFIKEPLDSYSDAQIGAAVRDVHRDCAKVLDRLFAIKSIVDQQEGSPVEVPSGFDAGRYRLTGNVVGDPPFRGSLAHHGWEAAEVQLPAWSGTPYSARVVAPVEVELA